jgi:hypothetical protein
MNSSWLRLAFALIVIATALPVSAANDSAAVTSAKKAVNDTEKQIKTAKSDLKAAERDHQQAQTAAQNAVRSAQAALQSAAKKQADALGLTAAITERDAAAKELAQKKAALLADLKSSSRYKQAESNASEASAKASKIRDDASLADDQRQKQLSELAGTQRQTSELERNEVENNPELAPLRQRFAAADAKCRQLQTQVNKAAEEDDAVRAAKTEITQKNATVKDEQKKEAAAQKNLDQAQQQLQRDEKKLQQAQAEERKTQKKKKNN